MMSAMAPALTAGEVLFVEAAAAASVIEMVGDARIVDGTGVTNVTRVIDGEGSFGGADSVVDTTIVERTMMTDGALPVVGD